MAIQLRGPDSRNGTGRVEVFYKGEWGTICRNGWDKMDTDVVCRELGYKYSIQTLKSGNTPTGTGRIWLSDVSCTGEELYISNCSLGGWGNNSCTHHSDVGVACSQTGNVQINFASMTFCHPIANFE